MRFLTDLFGCRACRAKDAQIERLEGHLQWAEHQLDLQNRRLAEIAAPRTNERVRASLRETPEAVRPAPRPVAPIIPGFEPPPEGDYELVGEADA